MRDLWYTTLYIKIIPYKCCQKSVNGKDRYQSFLRRAAYINLYAPVRHIASFLGIQPDSLSRIRRKKKD